MISDYAHAFQLGYLKGIERAKEEKEEIEDMKYIRKMSFDIYIQWKYPVLIAMDDIKDGDLVYLSSK